MSMSENRETQAKLIQRDEVESSAHIVALLTGIGYADRAKLSGPFTMISAPGQQCYKNFPFNPYESESG
jgi:hypothetical protein